MSRIGTAAPLVTSSLVIFCIAGCPPRNRIVEFRTTPPDASVTITRVPRSGERQTFMLPGATPVQHPFSFNRAHSYEAVLEKNAFQAKTISLTSGFVDSLPTENEVYVLQETLVEEVFQDIESGEVVIDPKLGLRVRIKTVRAFREDIEREGVPASRVVALGEGTWVGGITASPTDDRIAFSAVERVKDQEGKVFEFSTLRSVSGEGAGITKLTRGRWLDTDPSFSHSGKHLYFASNRLRTRYLDLFRIGSREAGGGIASIHSGDGWSRTPSTMTEGIHAFSFVPEYFNTPSAPHIWTLGGANQYPTQLLEGTDPELSPDANEIVYIGPDRKLWKFSLVSQTQVQLTTNPETCESDPTWSRDGKYILFVSNEGRDGTGVANNDIWVVRADGTDKRQLTTNGSDDSKVVVSFDQNWIYFVSNRGYKWGIWRIPWPSDLG